MNTIENQSESNTLNYSGKSKHYSTLCCWQSFKLLSFAAYHLENKRIIIIIIIIKGSSPSARVVAAMRFMESFLKHR